jgi:transcriptional regulator with XRE-family HTH domain
MNLPQIGREIRRARLARGLTQAQLAAGALLTRTTVNQLENGLISDLGVRKIEALLDQLGLELVVDRSIEPKKTDFLRVASATASVSFKTPITAREILRALLTGRVPANRRPHLRTLLEESPRVVMAGLLEQVTRYTKPGKVEVNLKRIAATLGIPKSAEKWSTT